MPLDANRLGNAIAATISSARPADGAAITEPQLIQLWRDVAKDIVDEITTNATVATTVMVTTPTGPGTGTGTGRVT